VRTYKYIDDYDPTYVEEQIIGHQKIQEQKQGCYYCAYFNGCHTATWRKGDTCDLFSINSKMVK